jgi:hypothetical protein
MITQETVLVQLIRLVDRIPTPPPPTRRSPGRPIFYSDRLFLKALLIMIVRRLHKVGELLAAVEEPTPQMQSVRSLCFPRRGASLRGAPSSAGSQGLARDVARADRLLGAPPGGAASTLGELGTSGGAGDSTLLEAKGGVWHNKDREKGEVPHSSIESEAHWGKSGWHG